MKEGALTSFTSPDAYHSTSCTVIDVTNYVTHRIYISKWHINLTVKNRISLVGFNTIYWWFSSGLLFGPPRGIREFIDNISRDKNTERQRIWRIYWQTTKVDGTLFRQHVDERRIHASDEICSSSSQSRQANTCTITAYIISIGAQLCSQSD